MKGIGHRPLDIFRLSKVKMETLEVAYPSNATEILMSQTKYITADSRHYK